MLQNKTVFVSGGTGFLGEEITERCVAYGAKVIFSFHNNEQKAAALTTSLPGTTSIRINLLDMNDINLKIDNVLTTVDALDVLINNAGISQVMPFALMEEEDYDLLMDVNVKGTFFLTKAIIRNMVKRKKGTIVNIGSIAGHRMYDVPVHYAVSKAAIQGFTYALAAELKKFNIRVNSVIPGIIEGGISEGIPAELREDFIKHCATGRPATGHEIADIVCFLASDKSSYINGQNILADGGI